jgi:hypothetical protein
MELFVLGLAIVLLLILVAEFTATGFTPQLAPRARDCDDNHASGACSRQKLSRPRAPTSPGAASYAATSAKVSAASLIESCGRLQHRAHAASGSMYHTARKNEERSRCRGAAASQH